MGRLPGYSSYIMRKCGHRHLLSVQWWTTKNYGGMYIILLKLQVSF